MSVFLDLLKMSEKNACSSFKLKHVLQLLQFPHLLAELYQKSFHPHHFKSGFHACGLYPLCRDAISSKKLSTALQFTKASEPEPGVVSGVHNSLVKSGEAVNSSINSGDNSGER